MLWNRRANRPGEGSVGFRTLLAWVLTVPMALRAAPGEFTVVTIPAGIDYLEYTDDRTFPEEVQILTGGAAAGDYNGDGWVDLFVTRSDHTDILYKNRGAYRNPDGPWFEDATEEANILINDATNGAAWGDIDNDGDLDLFVPAVRAPRFYLHVNQGDGTFVEEAVARGTALEGGTLHNGFSVSFGDYDRDGWLDIHVCEWGINRNVPDIENHTVLLRNRGEEAPGFFENVTAAAGVLMGRPSQEKVFAFSSTFADFDRDGWPDLAVASDFATSQLFWNNGDGTFTDGTVSAGVNQGSSEMGSAVGDFNGDGFLEWFTSNIEDNRFYLNLSGRQFIDQAQALGLQNAGWGWGTEFLDIENDGDLDLIMTNGYHSPETTKEVYYHPDTGLPRDVMHLWVNEDASYTDRSKDFGIEDEGEGKGLLLFDYDKDGDQDVFVTNTGEPPVLYRNDIDSGNAWLRLALRGTRSNSQGIGSVVMVTTSRGNPPRIYDLIGGNNFISQSEAVVHVGLGPQEGPVHEIEIAWPSGKKQLLTDVAINQHLEVVEPVLFTLDDWIEQEFPEEDRENQDIVGPSVDVEGDGIINLWEYALGLRPLEPDPQPLFKLQRDDAGEDSYRLSYTRSKAGDDFALLFECSTDLKNWTPIAGAAETVVVGELRDEVRLKFAKAGLFFVRIRIQLVP